MDVKTFADNTPLGLPPPCTFGTRGSERSDAAERRVSACLHRLTRGSERSDAGSRPPNEEPSALVMLDFLPKLAGASVSVPACLCEEASPGVRS
jgi:hypothetical protein